MKRTGHLALLATGLVVLTLIVNARTALASGSSPSITAFYASPSGVDPATLYWQTANVSECLIAGVGAPGFITTNLANGSAQTPTLTHNETYTIECYPTDPGTYGGWFFGPLASVAVAPTVTLSTPSPTIMAGATAPFNFQLGGGTATSFTYTVDGGTSVPFSAVTTPTLQSPNNSWASLVSGNEQYQFAFDSSDNLYVANSYASSLPSTIMKISPSGSVNSAWYTEASGNYPYFVAVDGYGNVWVSNSGSSLLQEISPSGALLNSYTHDGGGDLVFDSSGNLYVFSNFNSQIKKITPGGVITTYATLSSTQISTEYLAFDQSGNLYATTGQANKATLYQITPSGTVNTYAYTITLKHGAGTISTNLKGPFAIDPSGNVWASLADNYFADVSAASPIPFNSTFTAVQAGAAWDSSNNLYIAGSNSSGAYELQLSPPNFTYTVLGAVGSGPADVAFDLDGNLDVLNGNYGGSNSVSQISWAPTGSFGVSGLSAGTHTIVMTASNAGGAGTSTSVSVTVQAACQNGQGAQASCTSCNSGYVLSGGYCLLQCPNGQGPSGNCTSCNSGYTLSGGSCVLQSASGSLGTGSANIFTATPNRVRTGSNVTLSGSGFSNIQSCTIYDNATLTHSIYATGNTDPTSISFNTASAYGSAGITTATTFTLECTDTSSNPVAPQQASVYLVPTYQEI